MEKRSSLNLKKRLLGLFRSSNCSLTTRSLPDSVREPIFVSSRRHDHDAVDADVELIRSSSVPPSSDQGLFGRCRPAPKKKMEGMCVPENAALFYDAGGGKVCPPPASEMKPWFVHREKSKENRGRRKNKKKRKKKIMLFSNPYGFTTSSSSEEEEEEDDGDDDDELFSSDEGEEETDTLFSSRSFSSDSSEFYYNSSRSGRKAASRRRRPPPRRGASRRRDGTTHDGFRPLVSVTSRVDKKHEGEHGGDGFPVVKDSDDPYADFRISMLEMIVEKQTFGKEELAALLRSYLSLNSPHHHHIILKVFSDICEVLFCN